MKAWSEWIQLAIALAGATVTIFLFLLSRKGSTRKRTAGYVNKYLVVMAVLTALLTAIALFQWIAWD